MLKNLLISLRKKPKVMRNNVALGVSAVFTAFVVMFWAYSAPGQIISSDEKSVSETSSDFFQIFDNIKDQFATIKKSQDEQDENEDILEEFEDLSVASPVPIFTDDKVSSSTVSALDVNTNLVPTSSLMVGENGSSGLIHVGSVSTTTPSRSIRIVAVKADSTTTSTTTVKKQ